MDYREREYRENALRWATDIDVQVAANATCEHCEHVGLLYRERWDDGERVSIAVCPNCNYQEEF